MPVPVPLRSLVEGLERAGALDGAGKAVGKAVRGLLQPGPAKDAVSGTPFGHPVHPPLTDLVIGSFLGATLLDLLGARGAQRRLIGVGIAAALPTALTGASDWADTEVADPAVRRVGLVHAAANVSAVLVYGASLAARRRGGSGGRGLARAGAGILAVSGYLGGHMSYVRGVGPNRTAFDAGPTDWTPALAAEELRGEPRAVVVGDTPVLLVREGGTIHAVHDRCSHRGCSLAQGDFEPGAVTCSCHGSRFDLRDGSVLRGPATAGQPAFEAREAGGRVEVRLRERS